MVPLFVHLFVNLTRLTCLWRNIRVDLGMPLSAAARPSFVLLPPRFELCVTLITLKQGTISCSCTPGAFYDVNCSIKALQGLGTLYQTVCAVVCLCLCVFGVNALRLISTEVYSMKDLRPFNALDLNQSHRT